MAYIQQKEFRVGNIRITTAIEMAKAHEFDHDTDYTHQSIVGIDTVHYDANVSGEGEPDWVVLEKGVDIGELFGRIKELEGQLKAQKMYNGRLKKRAESMGLLLEEDKGA